MLKTKSLIVAALKGSTSNKPVLLETILAKAENDTVREELRVTLETMAKNMEVMTAKVTKKGVEKVLYWESSGTNLMPFVQLHPHRTISARIF